MWALNTDLNLQPVLEPPPVFARKAAEKRWRRNEIRAARAVQAVAESGFSGNLSRKGGKSAPGSSPFSRAVWNANGAVAFSISA